MADNLKVAGLRLVIEGAAQFNSTIGQINSQVKLSSAEFSKLQAQFGNNSKSVELLAGKQKLLQDKLQASKDIGAQYNRILDETVEKYGENSKEADQVRAAIAKNEAEQVKLEKQLEAVTRQLNIQASAWTQFGQKCQAAGQKLKDVGDKVARVGQTLTKTVTAPIVGLGAAVVKTTADFDAEMSKVSAISGATGEDFDALRAKAREMGAETKFSASEAASAMEYMAMAGWKTEDMLEGISGIMSLAAASGEDLAMVSDIVTDGLTAFGMAADESGRFADVLAAASSNANTNVSMLGESFKYVAPLAGSMGYSVEDTALALGLMANSGIKASNAGTALRTLLTNMAKPTDDMAEAMARLGVSLDDGEGNMLSLYDILLQLRQGFGELKISTEEYDERLKELNEAYEECRISEDEHEDGLIALAEAAFGAEGAMKAQNAAMLAGKTGLSGLMAIVNASDDDFNKLTEAIYGAEGSAEAMAAIMQDNLKGQLQILMSQLQELAISFGDILTPKIRSLVGKLQEFTDRLNAMDDSQRESILRIAAFAAAIGPVLLVVGKLVSGIGSIVTVIGTLSTAIGAATAGGTALSAVFTAMTGPIGIVVAAVAALAAVFIGLFQTDEEFRASVIAGWEELKEFFSELWSQLSDIFSAAFELIKAIVQNGLEAVKQFWDRHGEAITTAVNAVWTVIKTVIETVLTAISGIIKAITQIIQGDWKGAWETVKTTASTIWENIKTNISSVFENIKTAIHNKLEEIKTKWKNAWDNVKTTFNTAGEAIKTAIGSLGTAIKAKFEDLVGKAKEWGRNMIQGFVEGIKSMIGKVREAAASVTSAAGEYTGFRSPAKKGEGRYIVQWGANMVKGFIDGMNSMHSTLAKASANMSSAAVGGFAPSTTDNRSYSYGGITVQNLTVRNDADIKAIARELYRLQVSNARGKGVVV